MSTLLTRAKELVRDFVSKGDLISTEQLIGDYSEPKYWAEKYIPSKPLRWLTGFGNRFVFFYEGQIFYYEPGEVKGFLEEIRELQEVPSVNDYITEVLNDGSHVPVSKEEEEEEEEEKEEEEVGPEKTTIQKDMPSLAGTAARYFKLNGFRIRNTEEDNLVRIHIEKSSLRDRPGYVAIDLDRDSFLELVLNLSFIEQD